MRLRRVTSRIVRGLKSVGMGLEVDFGSFWGRDPGEVRCSGVKYSMPSAPLL
jgi:hypothetical protein